SGRPGRPPRPRRRARRSTRRRARAPSRRRRQRARRRAIRVDLTRFMSALTLRSTAVALLAVEELTRRFGGIVAVDGVSLDVGEGEIVGLIGPNGAGKTTVFNLITRLYRPDNGEVVFARRRLLRSPAPRL